MRRRDLLEGLPIVDEDTVQRLRGLMADVSEDGEDLARDLLETFRTDIERRLHAFASALARDDPDDAAEAVHALKGASATVGAPRVSALCAAVEQELRAKVSVEDATGAIRDEARAALAALEAALMPGSASRDN